MGGRLTCNQREERTDVKLTYSERECQKRRLIGGFRLRIRTRARDPCVCLRDGVFLRPSTGYECWQGDRAGTWFPWRSDQSLGQGPLSQITLSDLAAFGDYGGGQIEFCRHSPLPPPSAGFFPVDSSRRLLVNASIRDCDNVT